MAYELILTETQGRVGIIKFNRPEKLNALSNQMREETLDQIGVWNNDAIVSGRSCSQGKAVPSAQVLISMISRTGSSGLAEPGAPELRTGPTTWLVAGNANT